MNPDTRRLLPVGLANRADLEERFNMLMGKGEATPRLDRRSTATKPRPISEMAGHAATERLT
jgi:DNA gyrase/topoisomerase IV subunit B